MKKVLLSLMAAFALTLSVQAADKEIVYNLGKAAANYGTGTKSAETYDLAILIQDPALVGQKVKAVRIDFPTVDGVSNTTAWLSEAISVKSQKFTGADVETVEFEAVEGVNEVAVTPYTITEAGIYVGYSFEAEGQSPAIRPVKVTDTDHVDGGFYIHSSKLYRTAWRDLSTSSNLAISVVLEGDFKDNAASIANVTDINAKTNAANEVSFDLVNHGVNGIQSVDYTISVAGISEERHADLNPAIEGVFGRSEAFTVAVPVVSEQGAYELKVEVTKVNGQANEGAIPAGSGLATFFNTLPIHRPVCEEYTGLWCGWCPRGFVGMEKMYETYGADFIGICYHNGDDMEIMASSQFPMNISGFPSADVDRLSVIDPNFLEFQSNWKARREVFSPLAVEVKTQLTGDDFAVTAMVTSPVDLDNTKYALQFVVTQNGMQDESWRQSNYYAGNAGYKDGYMDWFCDQGSYVTGLTFNDVIILWSGRGVVDGSLPAHFEGDVAAEYTYTFDLTQANNTSGKNIVQDKSQLKGVVLVIDTTTGLVINANQAWANEDTTVGVVAKTKDEVVRHTQFFDMQGRRVLNPSNGLFIKAETLQNGKVRTSKVVF